MASELVSNPNTQGHIMGHEAMTGRDAADLAIMARISLDRGDPRLVVTVLSWQREKFLAGVRHLQVSPGCVVCREVRGKLSSTLLISGSKAFLQKIAAWIAFYEKWECVSTWPGLSAWPGGML